MFKRKLYDVMKEWKDVSKGKRALLIQGARRVGKSTIVGEFAKNEYKSHILIDFSHAPKEVNEMFEDIHDLDYFFLQLQQLYGVRLYERESVIVFDEVQLQPLARQAIKHLVADGRYDYIETGSLISIKKNIEKIVIPSEERKLTLHPMDFEEFRWALGDDVTVPLLRESFQRLRPLGDAAHRKLMRDFRLYMLVGGMPQAVSEYISTNHFQSVDMVKRDIISLYEDDFMRIDKTGRVSLLFDAVPAELGKHGVRYQLSGVLGKNRVENADALVAELKESMTVVPAYHANDPAVGMSLNKNIDFFKLYLADTGLFVTLAFKDKDYTENVIYERLLADRLSVNLGYVYENAVAQVLRSSGCELFYYTFPTDSKKHSYEVDFLLSKGNKLWPIEVKSSGYRTHASLDAFSKKYSRRIDKRFLIYTKDLRVDGNTIYLPIYMSMFLGE